MTIEQDVERILSAFAERLEGIEVSDEAFLQRERSLRAPEPRDAPPGFKARMLDNAPKTDGESIVAEKRSW